MTEVISPSGGSGSAVQEAAPQAGRLAGQALGLPSVLFCIVTGAAPLTAMLFNVPVAVQGGGYAAPAAFLIATVALTIFSVGYIAMSRRVRIVSYDDWSIPPVTANGTRRRPDGLL